MDIVNGLSYLSYASSTNGHGLGCLRNRSTSRIFQGGSLFLRLRIQKGGLWQSHMTRAQGQVRRLVNGFLEGTDFFPDQC